MQSLPRMEGPAPYAEHRRRHPGRHHPRLRHRDGRARAGWANLERGIDRTELYDADEVFFTGTGVHIAPATRVDGRRIGTGEPGPLTMDLQRRYLRAVRGEDPAYASWCTPVI